MVIILNYVKISDPSHLINPDQHDQRLFNNWYIRGRSRISEKGFICIQVCVCVCVCVCVGFTFLILSKKIKYPISH